MKRFLFSLWRVENGHKNVESHEESFESCADAMMRARSILKEAKRDGCGIQIDLYEKLPANSGWRHAVSYQ